LAGAFSEAEEWKYGVKRSGQHKLPTIVPTGIGFCEGAEGGLPL
jgi:hypothetical protein